MSGWRQVLLQEIASSDRNSLVGGPFGSDLLAADYVEHGVPVIRGENLSGGRWVCGPFAMVSERKAAQLAANTARPGDVIFTQRGANHYRQISVVPNGENNLYVISQSQMKLTVDRKKTSPLFIYYTFRNSSLQSYLRSHAIQTGVPHTNLSILKNAPLRLPDLKEQDAIVEILGSLDDKIELNRRISKTLEAMAQAIFRDWFVDFGPTRRKMAGMTDPVAILGGLTPDPAKAASLASLFPAILGDNGLPERWTAGILGDLAENASDIVDPGSIEPETPYIGLEHMPRRSIALAEWESAAKVSSNKARFREGQILFGKLRPYFHKVGIAPVDGVCSTDVVVIEARSREARPMITACVSSEAFVAYTDQTSTGTKMPRTSWATMRKYSVARTPKSVIKAFGSLAVPMLDKITASIHESRTLAEIRDLLLPQLMSGEIRLADARAAGEEAFV